MVLQFAVLVGLAVAFRRRPDVHKRLMLLATISILPPAVARFHLENHGLDGAYTNTLIAYALVVVAAAFDFARMRRVHAVYICGRARNARRGWSRVERSARPTGGSLSVADREP